MLHHYSQNTLTSLHEIDQCELEKIKVNEGYSLKPSISRLLVHQLEMRGQTDQAITISALGLTYLPIKVIMRAMPLLVPK